MSDRTRISPGSRAETGAVNAVVVRAAGMLAGTREPPHRLATLAPWPRS